VIYKKVELFSINRCVCVCVLADELHVYTLMEGRVALDRLFPALGDPFLRMTAAVALTNLARRLVHVGGGKVSTTPHIADAFHCMKVAQEPLKRLNTHVRAIAMRFIAKQPRLAWSVVKSR
jgi:hypothetical protein